MSTLELESVISNEIINEFSQKASGTVIWRDCSNWLNEERTFTELRNYAPSWFSMLIMRTSSDELLELASNDHRQDTRYSVAINAKTPRFSLAPGSHMLTVIDVDRNYNDIDRSSAFYTVQ